MKRLMLLLFFAAPSIVLAADKPNEVIEQSAQALLNAMEGRRESLRHDPVALFELVELHFLPHFDRAYAAFLVLGRHSRKANTEQKRRFTDALYNYILRQYATGLLEFTSERLNVLPYKGDETAERATVRTEVYLDDGTEVPVNYKMRRTDQGWKVYDVTVEGISYVKNFRTQFGAEIQAKGLDALIARLEVEVANSAVDKSETATESLDQADAA